jgi:ubiquinone/menaquinone biosynthesis C-methylase UbiE
MANETYTVRNRRRLLLPEMEGMMARWYDRQRGTPSQIAAYREQAAKLTGDLQNGAEVLEVAPGPGYLAIEIARLGRFQVTGLDISRTMVDLARENATKAGVTIDFRHGDSSGMPFADESFDLIVCQAAFKNFRQPVSALDEMRRVLRQGGLAVIQDLNREVSAADIDREVKGQQLSALNGFITKLILAGLRRRAYSKAKFEHLVAESSFSRCAITTEGIGLEIRLVKGSPS